MRILDHLGVLHQQLSAVHRFGRTTSTDTSQPNTVAQIWYPSDGISRNNGYGPDAVPGSGVNCQAGCRNTFEDSIKLLGDKLVSELEV